MEIRRSALVPFTPMKMYSLVADVPSYPEFLSWCVSSEVLRQDDQEQLARLDVSLAGLRQSFTTLNRLYPGEALLMDLGEGPFRSLSGRWQFSPLGEVGCKVELVLGFEFSSAMLSRAFQNGFARVADRLVSDFGQRARIIYHASAKPS